MRWLVSLAVGLWGAAGSVEGQDGASCGLPDPSWCGLSARQADFLLAGRRAAEPYQDLAVAVVDGFRPVGASAPAMGRHWISLARLFDGKIDPGSPDILMYASVDGRETLVGIAYGYVAGSGDRRAPPPNPFEPDEWHVHSGRLDLESHGTDHDKHALPIGESVVHTGEEAGVSVLHAWMQVANPAGVIEPNNWFLPYFRVGQSRPEDATPEADRAISLVSMGAGFFIERARLFADGGSGQESDWTAALRAAEAEVIEWWQSRTVGALGPDDVEWLGNLWIRFGLQGL